MDIVTLDTVDFFHVTGLNGIIFEIMLKTPGTVFFLEGSLPFEVKIGPNLDFYTAMDFTLEGLL